MVSQNKYLTDSTHVYLGFVRWELAEDRNVALSLHMVMHTGNLSSSGLRQEDCRFGDNPGNLTRPCLRIMKDWRCNSVGDHLPSKYRALGSILGSPPHFILKCIWTMIKIVWNVKGKILELSFKELQYLTLSRSS